MNQNRYIVYTVAAVLVAGLFFGALNFSSSPPKAPLPKLTAQSQEAVPIVGNVTAPAPSIIQTSSPPREISPASQAETAVSASLQERDLYVIPTIAGKTVLEAMEAYQASGGITFTGREYTGLGFFVETINGKVPADGKYWFLYVNDGSAQRGASQTTLHAGDRVEWRYQERY